MAGQNEASSGSRRRPTPNLIESHPFIIYMKKKSMRNQRAFTLIELLVVLSIIALVTVFAVPAIVGPTSSGQMNQNLLQLSGLLERGRQYAVAQNTYVWVAFAPGTDASGRKTLTVAMLASKDGIDPASPLPWTSFSYGAAPSNTVGLVDKIATFHQLSLSDAGTFVAAQVPNLPTTAVPVSAAANSLAQNAGGFFDLQIPGISAPQAFTEAVQFTPSGEARNGPNPIDLVELDLQPQKGAAALDAANIAVIRLNGLTGESEIYRR
jgi:prepilin-type N-terminal cleavage/methylation domain-containing protein